LLVFISVILIFTAPGVCFTRYINDIQASNEICPNENFFPMNVDRWRHGVHFQQRGQNVWGQLAIVIIAILFALPSLGFSCVQLASGNSLTYPVCEFIKPFGVLSTCLTNNIAYYSFSFLNDDFRKHRLNFPELNLS
ncbi:unnamed protein product, partial [Toxocara canis]|uniref:G_PROTEIN_RECEP_F1_2 domain-containing protein n=1 Tax=Toxocara canis TaxID=6265 RepID=A0A183U5U1_TOXCA